MNQPEPVPIYIVSGGVGASGEQLVHTVLAQFPDSNVPVYTIANVRAVEQIDHVIAQARAAGGTIVHTLVDQHLRDYIVTRAHAAGVAAIDLMGPLLARMTEVLGKAPLGQPGLYYQLHRGYFERVAAIEYTLAHDDGLKPEGWPLADVVLVGVSRTGKTPLCVYLSVLGWKAANVPIVLNWEPPPALFHLDARRVVGLTMGLEQLVLLREQRYKRLGALAPREYVDFETIREEMRVAQRVFQRGGFAVIDVTDKPIETSADEVIKLVTQQTRRGYGAPA